MYNIGDTVVYGSSGVMTVVDICDESFSGQTRRYYVLAGGASNLASKTFVPLDSERLVAQMRPLVTKDEIFDILHNMDRYPEPEWVPDNRARQEVFKSIMESGDRGRIIAMIRSIHKTGIRRSEEGKKNYLSDENLMNKAQRILYAELAIVLGIPEGEVGDFIERECGVKV